MSAQLGREHVYDLPPEEVARGLAEGKILLVDVREPNETEIERYPEVFICRCRSLIRPQFPIRLAAGSCSPAAQAIAPSPPR